MSISIEFDSGNFVKCLWSTRKFWSSPKCRGRSSRSLAWRHQRRKKNRKRWRHQSVRRKMKKRNNQLTTWSRGRWTEAGWKVTFTRTPPRWRCLCGRKLCTTSRWIWWTHPHTSAAPHWPSTPIKRRWWRQSSVHSRRRHWSTSLPDAGWKLPLEWAPLPAFPCFSWC